MLRPFFHALAFASLWAPGAALFAAEAPCEAAVVFRSGSEAYDAAVSGIRQATAAGPCRIQYVDLADPASDKMVAALAISQELVAAVGIGACERFKEAGAGLRLLPALVLRNDLQACGARRAGAVYADVRLVTVLEHLHELFPQKLRVGLIRRPATPTLDPGTLARVQQLGYRISTEPCSGPDKLLAAFSSLKGRADFVIAEPDAELYNSATIKPLVLAAIDQRLPIVGFSAGFVRAGAMLGVYPDFRDLGCQTGELIEQILLGKGASGETGPRKIEMVFNPRIARLIGFAVVHIPGLEEIK
jgi:ABC transporter substrate binding protein